MNSRNSTRDTGRVGDGQKVEDALLLNAADEISRVCRLIAGEGRAQAAAHGSTEWLERSDRTGLLCAGRWGTPAVIFLTGITRSACTSTGGPTHR